MDCHDFARAKSRNDDKKVDSSTATILKQSAKDSRICDEKSGLCEATQGRALGVRNRRVDEAIYDLSRKAESSKQQLMPLIARVS